MAKKCIKKRDASANLSFYLTDIPIAFLTLPLPLPSPSLLLKLPITQKWDEHVARVQFV